MILDIGCGNVPQGDVNLDKYGDYTPHIGRGAFLEPKKYPNFIIGTAEVLPFRDSIFSRVYSSHLLEHLFYPVNAIKEAIRVSKENSIICFRLPNEGGSIAEWHPMHIFSWTPSTFRALLKNFFVDVKIYTRTNIGVFQGRKFYRLLCIFRLDMIFERWYTAKTKLEIVAICWRR